MNALDRIRILIVENEGLVGCDMANTLAGLGYDVIGACQTGEVALDMVRDMLPDLVLMDIHLAGHLDGVETARKIKEASSAAIVYVTACADLKTVARARETQPHGYLLKPFSEDELRLTVEVAATKYLEEVESRRREQSYFQAFQSLPDGVIATDLAGTVVFLNPAATRIIGWSNDEVAGRSLNEVFRLFHPGGDPAEIQVVDESGSGPQRTIWVTTKNGERVPISDRTTALRDQRNSLTGLIILFRRLSPPTGIESNASQSGQELVNRTYQAATREPAPPQLVAEVPVTRSLPPPMPAAAQSPTLDPELASAVTGLAAQPTTLLQPQAAPPVPPPVQVFAEPPTAPLDALSYLAAQPSQPSQPFQPLHPQQSHPTGSMIQQPTAALAAASQLPASMAAPAPAPPQPSQPDVAAPAPLVDVVESISDPLIALDGLWRLTYANAAAARLFSRDKIAILGTSLWDLMPSIIREAHQESLAHAMLHRETVSRDLYMEAMQVWLELRAYPFGEGMLLLLKDTTARHEEAERRNRLDRLESLGLLARGFAHDFNNLLTVLIGNLSLAEMRLRGQSDRIPELATAKQATLQAQNLVQQLLTFARGGAPIKRHITVSELIDSFFKHHSRATAVQYRVEIQPGLPSLAVDPNQIRRLLGNLIRNAEQSMPRGGELTIRCLAPNPVELFGPDADGADQPTGIMLEVSDSGEGIAPDNLPHIFEPYFSTRKAQNATGLGLTVCESIAKAHGGSLSVRSEHGYGTTVRFYIPVDPEEDTIDELGIGRTALDLGTENAARILILEDDPLVRSLIQRNLTSQGFEVIETADGTDTIRRYQEAMDQARPIDLVVLDLTIPNGLGGVRTMERLRQLDPNVLAIVSSGYSDDPVMAKPAAYGFSAVLPKPYEPSDLLRLVKSVLNARKLTSSKKP